MTIRDDQTARLGDLTTQVMDAFLDAADPGLWAGAGQDPASMDPQTRGARNWDMKNANQAGSLMARLLDLRERLAGVNDGGGKQKPDDEAEHDIKKYEKQAKQYLDQVQAKTK